ncbi:MAG: prephenate dehydratase [Tissierellales bacterium]|jgi:chorismate mutase/prephenate dehydratase|nr:prephenate dehydratase [Tissierellales bacterium]
MRALNEKEILKLGFQGVEGSYSEAALRGFFGGYNYEKNAYSSFGELIDSIINGDIDYGVLPVENSSTGAVTEIYDLLNKKKLQIIGEHYLKINHQLMVKQGESINDIKRVYSHPQAISQCREYLSKNPNWEIIAYTNTAKSAQKVSRSSEIGVAAIGGIRAAELYDLDVLESGINDCNCNTTRFIIVTRCGEVVKAGDKMSLILTIPHRPGCLYELIGCFANEGINMLKIESRPIKDQPWEYYFYIDIEGNQNDENMQRALKSAEDCSHSLKILGNYIRDKKGGR